MQELPRQATNLTHARSVTTYTFNAAERASNLCQVGNIGAAVRVIQGWLQLTAASHAVEKGRSAGELAEMDSA